MCIKRYCITLIFLLLCVGIAHSQDICTERGVAPRAAGVSLDADTLERIDNIKKRHTNIEVHFRFSQDALDLDYMGNGASLRAFSHKIDSIGISQIDSVVIVLQSSPDGVYEHNLKLARDRANTMRRHLLASHPELRDYLHVYSDGESWAQLREYVERDTLMKRSTIEKVLSIIDADVNVGTKKWRMAQLPVYRYLLSTYYSRIRNAVFYILYYSDKHTSDPSAESVASVEADASAALVEPIAVAPLVESVAPVAPVALAPTTPFVGTKSRTKSILTPSVLLTKGWTNGLYIKTNTLGLGLAISNIGAEVDLAKHWSFAVPLYYSAHNYFVSTIKFRTLAVQPEFRYWFREDNQSLFVGAHFAYVQYNVAVDGDYRYQDRNGTSPMLGGGVSVGYRMPISSNERWHIEFTLGLGVYNLHYDKFYNVPNGRLVGTYRKTYFGLDNAAVNISYRFNLKKRKLW